MGARIYLDVTRLLTAGRRSTPSGIERVELAYVKRFGRADGTRFVGHFLGRPHLLPYRFTLAYIMTLENAWKHSNRTARHNATAGMVGIYILLLAIALSDFLRPAQRRGEADAVYLNLSHQNITSREALSRFKSRSGAKFLFFVHDLIPITHPEYARPGQPELHRRRMDNVAALADAVLVNSAATRDDFLRYLKGRKQVPEIYVAHLGINPVVSTVGDGAGGTPYFLMLATIEPRKNHLLALNLWRRLVEEGGAVPRLIIVGRRGWENEMVLDMLDRCAAIAGVVEERRDMGDEELNQLMRNAKALLLPSFAEGFGLPVAEALSAGTPVICSDLPALREIGGDVPEYIDPLDGPTWRRAILDYAEASSPRREAQCKRMPAWNAPGWEAHFSKAEEIIEGLVTKLAV